MDSLPGYRIDHIGIAVSSVEEAFALYEALGWKKARVEEVPSERVRVGFVEFENQSDIELLEPTSGDSVIAKFIDKRGPGIHHVCFRVPDIEVAMKSLTEKGFRLIDETPRIGAGGCRVAFVHPKSSNGVLIELSEKVDEV